MANVYDSYNLTQLVGKRITGYDISKDREILILRTESGVARIDVHGD